MCEIKVLSPDWSLIATDTILLFYRCHIRDSHYKDKMVSQAIYLEMEICKAGKTVIILRQGPCCVFGTRTSATIMNDVLLGEGLYDLTILLVWMRSTNQIRCVMSAWNEGNHLEWRKKYQDHQVDQQYICAIMFKCFLNSLCHSDDKCRHKARST